MIKNCLRRTVVTHERSSTSSCYLWWRKGFWKSLMCFAHILLIPGVSSSKFESVLYYYAIYYIYISSFWSKFLCTTLLIRKREIASAAWWSPTLCDKQPQRRTINLLLSSQRKLWTSSSLLSNQSSKVVRSWEGNSSLTTLLAWNRDFKGNKNVFLDT